MLNPSTIAIKKVCVLNYCIFKAFLNIESESDVNVLIEELLSEYKTLFSLVIFSTPDKNEIDGILIASSESSRTAGLEFETMTSDLQQRFMDDLKHHPSVLKLHGSPLLPIFDDEFCFSNVFQRLADIHSSIQFNHVSELLMNELDARVESSCTGNRL
jgi:hypothetical protein